MSKIIRTQYDGKCRTCQAPIEQGDNVRWTKGVKGVVCMSCPDDATGTTPASAAQTAEVKRLNVALEVARETFRQQRDRITVLQAEVAALQAEVAAFKAQPVETAPCACIGTLPPIECVEPVAVDDDCPI